MLSVFASAAFVSLVITLALVVAKLKRKTSNAALLKVWLGSHIAGLLIVAATLCCIHSRDRKKHLAEKALSQLADAQISANPSQSVEDALNTCKKLLSTNQIEQFATFMKEATSPTKQYEVQNFCKNLASTILQRKT